MAGSERLEFWNYVKSIHRMRYYLLRDDSVQDFTLRD